MADPSDSEDELDGDSSLIPPIATLDFSSAFEEPISTQHSPVTSRKQTPMPEVAAPPFVALMPTPESTPAPPELDTEVTPRKPTPGPSTPVPTPAFETDVDEAKPTEEKVESEPLVEKKPLGNSNALDTQHAVPVQAMVRTPSSHIAVADIMPASDLVVEESTIRVDPLPLNLMNACPAEPSVTPPPSTVEEPLVCRDLHTTPPSSPLLDTSKSSPLTDYLASSRASSPPPLDLLSCDIEAEVVTEMPLACPMDRSASPMTVDVPVKTASQKSKSKENQPKASTSKTTLDKEQVAPVKAAPRPRTISAKRKPKQDVEEEEEPVKKRTKVAAKPRSVAPKAAARDLVAEFFVDAVEDLPRPRKTSKSEPKPKPKAKKTKRASSPVPVPGLTPTRIAELQGMIIESFAVSRASSLPASALYAAMAGNRPSLKDEHPKVEWLSILEAALGAGESGCGMFGKVESSFKVCFFFCCCGET